MSLRVDMSYEEAVDIIGKASGESKYHSHMQGAMLAQGHDLFSVLILMNEIYNVDKEKIKRDISAVEDVYFNEMFDEIRASI